MWYRAVDELPDDPALHRYLLAYASDFSFLGTAMDPHGTSWLQPGMQVASVDHVMWFHRPFRIDDWLLYVVDSPSASAAAASCAASSSIAAGGSSRAPRRRESSACVGRARRRRLTRSPRQMHEDGGTITVEELHG